MIKPELDTELDIVNSCFTIEESDKSETQNESSLSTFLENPENPTTIPEKPKVYENDPNYKIDSFMTTFEIGTRPTPLKCRFNSKIF